MSRRAFHGDPWPDRPLLLGIVNVTPDSFSDGGSFLRWERAVGRGLDLVREGADMLDVGGESTRPGSRPVSADEEMSRVIPVVRALAGEIDVPLSIDTQKPEVAREALAAGASWVNDVGGLRIDAMAEVVAEAEAGVIAMHMRGEPATMQDEPVYDDVVENVRQSLRDCATRAHDAGIHEHRIWLDPGIGFGKTLEHNLLLLANLDRLADLGYPLVIGASRKSFIAHVVDDAGEDRLPGSLAAAGAAATIPHCVIRVHDVAATRQYLLVRHSIDCGHSYEWPRPEPEATRERD